MKKNSIKTITTLILVSLFSCVFSQNQTNHSHSDNHNNNNKEQKTLNEKIALEQFGYDKFMKDFIVKSLEKGYDFQSDECLKNVFIGNHSNLLNDIFNIYIENNSKKDIQILYDKHMSEFLNYLEIFKRNENKLRIEYDRRVKSSHNSFLKFNNPFPLPQSSCINMDFETGDLTGWTTTSSGGGASYATTVGQDPNVNAINTVFAGNNSACIDGLVSTGNLDWVQIEQSFQVTNANKDFIFYTAVIIDRPGHTPCSDNAKFEVSVKDANGSVIPCSNVVLLGANAQGNACSVFNGFQTFGNFDYLNWTPIIVPLGSYVGQIVTIRFRVTRCNGGGAHGARAYIEASCNPTPLQATGNLICPGKSVYVNAPNVPGYIYNWAGPSGFSANTYSINPNLSGVYTVTMAVASNPTCKMVLDTVLTSVPSPTASFNYTLTPCTTTFSVPVASNSSSANNDPIAGYTWVWNDATANGSGPSNSHTYLSSGTKTIELKITSQSGCRDSVRQSFTINTKPVVDFNTQNNCLTFSSTFTSVSTPSSAIAAQVWTFGDASPNGMGTQVNHTYLNPGTYNVKLVATSVDLCKDSITKPITIYPKPVISFTASSVCLGVASAFNNTSNIIAPDMISNWAWDFDNNGTTDNATQNPTFTYGSSGNKVVELKATSNQGCSDSTTRTIRVNENPTPSFNPINNCLNTNILLNNSSSIPLPDNITNYNWNFGANASIGSSTLQNPSSLTYNTSGIKTITLSLTANTSCTATITRTVEVYPQPVANFSVTSICEGLTTNYTDLSNTAVGTIASWEWDFTNNNSIDNTSQNPSLIFSASGTYTTSLIVTTNNGCKDTVNIPLNVWGRAIPNFSPDNVCYGTATAFSNQTNITTNANVGVNPSYTWDFNDGSALSNLQNPSHTYINGPNGNAVYNVTLTVTTVNNCVNEIVKPVRVFALPTASFTSDSVCFGSPTSLIDASNGNGNTVNNFYWDYLSNGTIDVTSISNPQFIFPNYGVNLVSYTVSTTPTVGLVCINSTNTISVYVHPNPIANFSFINKCINEQPINFDATTSSIMAGSIVNYDWAYGNGLTNSGILSSHNFVSPGTYSVTLLVTSNKGCQGTIIKPVIVFPKPIMAIVNSPACDGRPVIFNANSQSNSGNVTSWNWDFNNSITSFEAQGQSTSYTFPSAGNHTVALVSITDNGCRDTISMPFYVDYVPVPQFSVNRPSGCPEHCVVFSDLTPQITGPGQNAEWKWHLGDGTVVTSNNNGTQSHCYTNNSSTQSALFDVKLVVTTDRGCKDSLTKISYINVYPVPIAAYNASPNPANIIEPLVHFNNLSSDYTKWWWSFGDGPEIDSTNVSPYHEYSDINANTYNTYLIVQNQYGCRDTAYLKVEITPEFSFYIPNAFTPHNGDGINDYFSGIGIGIEKYEMWIFDRWGEMIYYTDDINKGWNGKVQGKTQECKQDVYIWKVKLKDVLGKKHDYVGHVTLLR